MENRLKIFLAKIQEKENKEFHANFIKKSSNKKISHFWKFSKSKNNAEILKNVQKNDWFLFAYDGKYEYASQVSNNTRFHVSFKKIKSISRSFMRTNSELGISSNMPSVHNFSLLQIDDDITKNVVKKYESIEKFLVEGKISTKKSPKKIVKNVTIEAASIEKIPKKINYETVRVIRDTVRTKKLKIRYDNKCQVCKYKIAENYSDVHHIWPIGDKPIGGNDDYDNMLVLCPNHHAMFDLALIQFDELEKWNLVHVNGDKIGKLYLKKDHYINPKNIEHNNSRVRKLHGT